MNSSLNTLAIQLSRRLAWKLALAFTAVLSLLVFLYFWSSKQETIETLANGMEKNFSYWMTVGDQFQIQRAILALGRQASIQSVTLFDKRSGMIIGSFQKKSAHNYFPKVSFSFPIRNELGQALGSLEVSFELSLVPFLLVSLLGMALVFLLARVLERSALRLTAEILQPVDKLVGALGKSTQVSDLANLRYEPENFIEIKKIAEVIQTMGCRVEENERALREAEKGESVRKVTRQLAHDIRSPLSALRILAQQHQQFAQAESKLFQTAIDRIESLAEGMLSASKLAEQNPLGGEIGEHSYSVIDQIVRETIALKKIELAERDIDLLYRPLGLSGWARFDTQELQRIISNLINNAAEAIEGAGTIELGGEKKRSYLVLYIKDDGMGISKEWQEKIGSEGMTTKGSEGYGYGLWHARKTLEAWGGQLRIESHVGQGTKVTLAFSG